MPYWFICLISVFSTNDKRKTRKTSFQDEKDENLKRNSSGCVKIFAPLILTATGKLDLAKKLSLLQSLDLTGSDAISYQMKEKITSLSIDATIWNEIFSVFEKLMKVPEKAFIEMLSWRSSFFELQHDKQNHFSHTQKKKQERNETWSSSKQALDESSIE